MKNVLENIEEYLYHFWLDRLEVYGTLKDEDFLMNHKVEIFLWYTIKRKFDVPSYIFKYEFYQWEKDMLFAYYKWMQQPWVSTKDYIVVHSKAFRILTEEDILLFLAQFDIWRVRRFDIAADVILPIDLVLWNFEKLKQKWATFNGKNWEVETQYFWEKQTTKNKRQLIRVYDKQADIYARGKVKLYADYLTQTHMTRVELEVRSELARNVYYEDLFDVPRILSIFKNYLYKHTKLFESLPWERITLFQKTQESIDPEYYQSLFYREQRRKIFLWHARSIFELWYCPIRALIAEGLIQEKTQRVIGIDICSILWELENKVVQRAKEHKKSRLKYQDIFFTD